MSEAVWESIQPRVNSEAEFYEIATDFGDPLELVREAISNAVDARATEIRIRFSVEHVAGLRRLKIFLEDNGMGMSKDILARDFWGLGFSPSRERPDAIGEKGHGTKIYLRSERVIVRTQQGELAWEAECDRPLANLANRKLHEPRIRPLQTFRSSDGTEIEVVGYNDNERSRFKQQIVRDYIRWFTKAGSIENVFGIHDLSDFRVFLQAIDGEGYEELSFGHPFPEENSNIEKLFEEHGTAAAEKYVKRYVWKNLSLPNYPEVTFDAVISVEGNEAKRSYNDMLRQRRRNDTGTYRTSDRYGLWLCKDYIPIVRVNDWISGFGSGSNAYVLLHAFINCQDLKLTANRGTIANTDPNILTELQSEVEKLISTVDSELQLQGLYTLRSWQEEQRTLEQERDEFKRRVKGLKDRRVIRENGQLWVEPTNESELFGIFLQTYNLRPDLFSFEPLDYNTSRGIDLIARNKGPDSIVEGTHYYVELKFLLRKSFNHSFKHIRWIVAWDLDKNVGPGSQFSGVEEYDLRALVRTKDKDGATVHYLDAPNQPRKIEVLLLRDLLRKELNIDFQKAAVPA